MGKLILMVFGLILGLIGVIMIFDSRIITKKFFSFGDQNEGTFWLKIIGFVIAIVGCCILFFINK